MFSKALENPTESLDIKFQEDDIDVNAISSDEENAEEKQEVQGSVGEKDEKEVAHGEEETNGEEEEGFTAVSDKTSMSEGSEKDDDSSSEENSSDESTSSGEDVEVLEENIDEDEDPAPSGPIRSKHEMAEEPVPEIPEDFTIDEKTTIHEIGEIKSAFDLNIIIQACNSAEQRVLKEGSILCLGDRTLIGALCEVFGKLQSPFYRVGFTGEQKEKFNALKERVGEKVYFVAPEAHWLDTFQLKQSKGTDASNGFDEELPEEEQEFSDDEKEAEFKRSKKQAKKRKNHDSSNSQPADSKKLRSNQQQLSNMPKMKPPVGMTNNSATGYKSRSTRQSERQVKPQYSPPPPPIAAAASSPAPISSPYNLSLIHI